MLTADRHERNAQGSGAFTITIDPALKVASKVSIRNNEDEDREHLYEISKSFPGRSAAWRIQ
jgi:hypothetical protein